MSGHSKWSSIKHKKGAADAKRGKLFSKLSRAIIVAAKEGGPDPSANLALQNAIEKARSSRTRCRRTTSSARSPAAPGADADAQAFETIVYEGYGPGGRGRDRRGADRQPQPDRLGRAAHVREERRQPGRLGRGRVAVRARGDRRVDADGVDEDELTLAAAEGGRRTSPSTARPTRSRPPPRIWWPCARRSRRPGSRSSRPS